MSNLINGLIPKDKDCPFNNQCPFWETCEDVRGNREQDFSCGLARGFDVSEDIKDED